jgi:hypothetical protein
VKKTAGNLKPLNYSYNSHLTNLSDEASDIFKQFSKMYKNWWQRFQKYIVGSHRFFKCVTCVAKHEVTLRDTYLRSICENFDFCFKEAAKKTFFKL